MAGMVLDSVDQSMPIGSREWIGLSPTSPSSSPICMRRSNDDVPATALMLPHI
jgi:hypothetical protein